MRDKRLFVAEAFRQYELECAVDEYERERALALRELEEKKAELKEYLLHELQEKKKAYETYRHSMELGSGGVCVCVWCVHVADVGTLRTSLASCKPASLCKRERASGSF